MPNSSDQIGFTFEAPRESTGRSAIAQNESTKKEGTKKQTARKEAVKKEEANKHTVGSLTKSIRNLLEPNFTDVVVEGEISNFLHHRSGHRYWTLKDPEAQIACVFWKMRFLSFDVEDGMKVLCRGRLTIYPPRGSYQFDVFQIRPVGIGDLQRAFEELYKKLSAEGLFDERRKRPIPRFPKTIGIVTSETGAALHDMLTVLRRRYPIVNVVLRPSAVQGLGAELEVARAIQDMNRLKAPLRPDVLIVGRGGGSLEDLWSFNEEAVARAIFASEIPVISAVGHEVDVTIADLVADLRAPTPTAAAELATPDRNELLQNIRGLEYDMTQGVAKHISYLKRELSSVASGYALNRSVREVIERKNDALHRNSERMLRTVHHTLEKKRLTIDRDLAKLGSLNPYAVLNRGYTILQTEDGQVIPRKSSLEQNQIKNAVVVFADGEQKVTLHTS